MLSVIIPTVQKKLEVLKKLVQLLDEDTSVDEIFVINNKPDTPLELYHSDKLKIYTPESNLYVNPSWNLGISKIKNENFVLMNDDLLIGKDFCKKIVESDIFNSEITGIIGVHPASIVLHEISCETLDIPESSNEPVFKDLTRYLETGDWGIAIFGKKKNYYKIPDDLKIIYGDNYLLYKNLMNNKKNFSVSNLPVNHIHSSSSASREFSKIVASDIKNSNKYFRSSKEPVLKNASYTIEFRGDVCIIEVGTASIYLKYKENGIVYSKTNLVSQITKLLPENNNDFESKIADDIISRSTSC